MKITDCISVPAIEQAMGCDREPGRDQYKL